MNKPTANYKMSMSVKDMIDKVRNPHDRGFLKRIMIDAEIEANKKPKMGKENRE